MKQKYGLNVWVTAVSR